MIFASCEVISTGKPEEVGFDLTAGLDVEEIAGKTSNIFPVVKGGVCRVRDGSRVADWMEISLEEGMLEISVKRLGCTALCPVGSREIAGLCGFE